jgi:hypothetical protein
MLIEWIAHLSFLLYIMHAIPHPLLYKKENLCQLHFHLETRADAATSPLFLQMSMNNC